MILSNLRINSLTDFAQSLVRNKITVTENFLKFTIQRFFPSNFILKVKLSIFILKYCYKSSRRIFSAVTSLWLLKDINFLIVHFGEGCLNCISIRVTGNILIGVATNAKYNIV